MKYIRTMLVLVVGALAFATTFVLSDSSGESLRFLIDLQETEATVTARWFYVPDPEYETWYDFILVDEAASDTIMADSTSLTETEFTIQRKEVDKAYRFGVRAVIQDALGSIARSKWTDDRLIIPAAPAAGLLAKRDMVVSPIVIPNDPAFEQTRGTLWLEFELRDDVTSEQGIWSRDASGYQGGGHLSVWINDGSVRARIQSDSVSYQLQWPVVANAINQAAVEFGDDTGFRLHVNGALAMSDPYTGGTVGNDNDIAVGAAKQNYNPDGSTPEYNNPLDGTVRVSEFYAGRYDFSGRWGLPPLPPPPPVDSLAIEVAQIDHGQVVPLVNWDGQPTQVDYFSVRFTPIREAAWIVRYVNGDTLDHHGIWQPATLPVAGGPWRVSMSDATGWRMYNEDTGELCNAPISGWTVDGTSPCVTRDEMMSYIERNNDCVGGRYWAKHNSEIECNFNINISQRATFTFPTGTNPTLRLEVFDENRQRIGYWERRVS